MPKTRLRQKPETSHVTYTDFRERLAAYMDQVWDSRAPLHVTRQGGRADGLSNLSQGWHTFTLSWTQNKLTWYIDNNQVFSTTTGIPQQDMYIIANLANTSAAATSCSGSMQIKSIKVWQP